MQPVELGNNCTKNSYFTMIFAYFAGAISSYSREIPVLVHVTVVIFSMQEHEKVDAWKLLTY